MLAQTSGDDGWGGEIRLISLVAVPACWNAFNSVQCKTLQIHRLGGFHETSVETRPPSEHAPHVTSSM